MESLGYPTSVKRVARFLHSHEIIARRLPTLFPPPLWFLLIREISSLRRCPPRNVQNSMMFCSFPNLFVIGHSFSTYTRYLFRYFFYIILYFFFDFLLYLLYLIFVISYYIILYYIILYYIILYFISFIFYYIIFHFFFYLLFIFILYYILFLLYYIREWPKWSK